MKQTQQTIYRPTRVEINLDCIRHNYNAFQKWVGDHTVVMPVIKANAYGHGAIAVANAVIEKGAKYLAVATLEEAIELRMAGIDIPVLVFGFVPKDALGVVVDHQLTMTVFDADLIEELNRQAEKRGEIAKIHVKVDTGMGRVGIRNIAQLENIQRKVGESKNVHLEAMYTHFAGADSVDKLYTNQQYEKFQKFMEVACHFSPVPKFYLSNSAGAIDIPEFSHDFVRVGISLYGLYPSNEVSRENVILRPAMEFKTAIVHMKDVEEDECIGYGMTYRTKRKSRIATLPVGYADGLNRLLSNKGYMLVRGERAPIVGRVCMDQTMIDVTDIPEAALHDEVVIFGTQNGNSIAIEEVAALVGTINYEILCSISSRVPRQYTTM